MEIKTVITHLLQGDSRSTKVKKNVLGSFIVKGITIMISMILVPLTIDYVSSELYGIWLTLATIISWMTLFDMGLGNGLKNKVAECVARYDWDKARRYISTTYVFFTIVFSLLSFGAWFLFQYVNWTSFLNISEEYQLLLVDVMRIVVVFFCLSMIVKIQTVVLQALQLNALSSAFDAIGQLLLLAVIFMLTITTQPSLKYLALAISACPLAVNIIVSIWMYGYKYKQLCPSWKLAESTLIKDVANLGVKFFIIQIAAIILFQTINVILLNVADADTVTEYNVIYKYISIPMMATSMVVGPFWTAFTDAYTLSDYPWMKRAYYKLLKIFIICIVILTVLVFLSPIVFKLWIGNRVIIHSSMVIAIAVYIGIMMWNNIHSTLINGTGRIKLQLYCCILSTILIIPIALWLGHMFGPIGVVVSVSLLNLPGSLFLYIQIFKIINNRASGIWNK